MLELLASREPPAQQGARVQRPGGAAGAKARAAAADAAARRSARPSSRSGDSAGGKPPHSLVSAFVEPATGLVYAKVAAGRRGGPSAYSTPSRPPGAWGEAGGGEGGADDITIAAAAAAGAGAGDAAAAGGGSSSAGAAAGAPGGGDAAAQRVKEVGGFNWDVVTSLTEGAKKWPLTVTVKYKK